MNFFDLEPRRFLMTLVLVGLVLAGAGWADLKRQGLLWDLLWNLTGETEAAAQVLGASQYLATLSRSQPDSGPAPTQQIPANPFGINTFLQLEADPANRERQMSMIAAAGFGWLRQEFPWEDIEIHGRGDFVDRRNDRNFDGTINEADAISAWEKYDHIVALADQHNLNLLVRLSNPPRWAQPANTTAEAPPSDPQDFVNFAVAVAERYRGRITHYQIWNEPNIYPEWGEQQIDPAAYADMLCRTYSALKAVDPGIIVHSAAIAPNIDLSGRDAYDLLYLQRLYDFGASPCFDVLSAQGYGLFSGPTDRRLRQFTINFGRHLWLRDVMVANGDAAKPIWISEAGWNPVPTAAEVPEMIARENYGVVSMADAAAYVPLAYQRMLSEWEHVGVMFYWFMKRPDESERNQSWTYMRLVEPDFTPTPIYDSFQRMIQAGEWEQWRGSKSWNHHARERLPQVLVLAWGLAFSVGVMVQPLLRRWMGR